MLTDIDLDHVAVAVEEQASAWPRYAGDLAGQWVGGGGTAGFWSGQVRYSNGMKVEVLEPHLVEHNDFLRRFLDRSGPGPHHLTYKVKDLRAALGMVETAGYRPVGVNLASPWWKEAFLHPKDAPGVVVQLAQSAEGGDWEDDPTPSHFPAPRTAEPAALVHVAHAVADLGEGARLFRDLLGGAVVADECSEGIRWMDLRWPGPGRVRLLSPEAGASSASAAALAAWLGGRPGRVHHVAFEAADPDGVASAKASSDGIWVVEPADNLGVRLQLAVNGASFAHPSVG